MIGAIVSACENDMEVVKEGGKDEEGGGGGKEDGDGDGNRDGDRDRDREQEGGGEGEDDEGGEEKDDNAVAAKLLSNADRQVSDLLYRWYPTY